MTICWWKTLKKTCAFSSNWISPGNNPCILSKYYQAISCYVILNRQWLYFVLWVCFVLFFTGSGLLNFGVTVMLKFINSTCSLWQNKAKYKLRYVIVILKKLCKWSELPWLTVKFVSQCNVLDTKNIYKIMVIQKHKNRSYQSLKQSGSKRVNHHWIIYATEWIQEILITCGCCESFL